MKVVYKGEDKSLPFLERGKGELGYLKENIEYLVMGIIIKSGKVYFHVDSTPFHNFPVLYNADFFEIIDSRLSSHWIYHKEKDELEITFKEWINVPNAIVKFIDGETGYTHEDGYYLDTYLHFRELLLNEKIN
ncbi:MAG: hypothetical protein V4622_00525 [Bacteroidota bacterium]